MYMFHCLLFTSSVVLWSITDVTFYPEIFLKYASLKCIKKYLKYASLKKIEKKGNWIFDEIRKEKQAQSKIYFKRLSNAGKLIWLMEMFKSRLCKVSGNTFVKSRPSFPQGQNLSSQEVRVWFSYQQVLDPTRNGLKVKKYNAIS